MTLSVSGFDKYTKTTRRAVFLSEMERVVPSAELIALIEPVYPTLGNGRPPVGLERMLQIYFLQHWFVACALANLFMVRRTLLLRQPRRARWSAASACVARAG